MSNIKILVRHVLRWAAIAACLLGAPAQGMSIAIVAPGCTDGGVLAWDATTKTVSCQGAAIAAQGSVTVVTSDCAAGTAIAWNSATATLSCAATNGGATPAASLAITVRLPDCVGNLVTWSPATNTINCPLRAAPASLTPFSGSGQSTPVSKPFDGSLVAVVRDANGNPLAGITVTFHVPTTGASATLASSSAITDANGLARVSAAANAVAGGYGVTATVAGVGDVAGYGMTNTAPAAPVVATLNVDKSAVSIYDPATDGLLILRYMFGARGPALIDGVVSSTAARNDPVAIAAYLDSIQVSLDVDNDGRVNALTDGILILRYMSGLQGAALIAGAVGAGANPGTAADIQSRIRALMP